MDDLSFREGTAADLPDTFALSATAVHATAIRLGVPAGAPPGEEEIAARWTRERPLLEFIAAQSDGRYVICENGAGPVGYARTVRFGGMEELTELAVAEPHQDQGVGRALLERCWPGDPTPDLGRVVVAAGAGADLTLYAGFGVMPAGGHWHLRQRTETYLERRSLELDATEPGVHVLKPERAVAEWQRLEPAAIGHDRARLHEFFGRDRTCLATMAGDGATALCWVSAEGEIGPAVGAKSQDLVPVVLAALDRVARANAPEEVGVFTTTLSWWLLRRLRGLGFRVFWPSWVMCSVPLPGLDRYVPTRPAHLL